MKVHLISDFISWRERIVQTGAGNFQDLEKQWKLMYVVGATKAEYFTEI
jgi:hypothetical protein